MAFFNHSKKNSVDSSHDELKYKIVIIEFSYASMKNIFIFDKKNNLQIDPYGFKKISKLDDDATYRNIKAYKIYCDDRNGIYDDKISYWNSNDKRYKKIYEETPEERILETREFILDENNNTTICINRDYLCITKTIPDKVNTKSKTSDLELRDVKRERKFKGYPSKFYVAYSIPSNTTIETVHRNDIKFIQYVATREPRVCLMDEHKKFTINIENISKKGTKKFTQESFVKEKTLCSIM